MIKKGRPQEDPHADPIPWHGTEFDSPESRARQAIRKRDRQSTCEIGAGLDALGQLTRRGCSSAPRMLGYKIDRQDQSMLVPGRGRREVLEALTYDAGLMIDRYGAGSAVCLFFFFLFACSLVTY